MGRAFVHRNVDMLASAAFQTMIKGRGDAERAVGRRHAVCDFARRLERRLARLAREIEQVAERQTGHVVGFVVAPRAGLAERSDRRDDQTGVAGG